MLAAPWHAPVPRKPPTNHPLALHPHTQTFPLRSLVRQDPVVLPDSKVTLDRSTIERHLLSSATDPFSRAPLAADQLAPDDALRARIEEWLAERGGALSPR